MSRKSKGWHDREWVDPDEIIRDLPPSNHTPASSGFTNASVGQSYLVHPRCSHTGVEVVFSLTQTDHPPLTFGGATGWTLEPWAADVILDCGHVFPSKPEKFVTDGPKDWLDLNKLVVPTSTVVRFDWPDQKAPGVGLSFWRKAVDVLTQTLPKGGHIIACCIGGHGRTGTCLASILISHSTRTATSAIDFIREVHCTHAIESKAQEDYLERLAAARDARLASQDKKP